MIDKTEMLDLVEDIKNTVSEKQEQTVFDYKVYSLCTQVQEFLKEQEAKPVKIVRNADGYIYYHCPKCNRIFYEMYESPKHCDICGQEVTWK